MARKNELKNETSEILKRVIQPEIRVIQTEISEKSLKEAEQLAWIERLEKENKNLQELVSLGGSYSELKTAIDLKVEEFKKIKGNITKLSSDVNIQKEEVKNQNTRTIEILALFATFFTFISVNVQVFSNLKNLYQSLIFVFFFGLILIAFLMLFFAYTRDFWEKGKIWRWVSVGVFLFLLVYSAFLVFSNRDLLTKQTFIPECENLSVEAGPRDCLITKEQMSDYLKNSKKDSNKN